jgi:hypothetical protein
VLFGSCRFLLVVPAENCHSLCSRLDVGYKTEQAVAPTSICYENRHQWQSGVSCCKYVNILLALLNFSSRMSFADSLEI